MWLSVVSVTLIGLLTATFSFGQSPLAPVKTDNPRDTMKTFMQAMNDYRKGVKEQNLELQARLEDAVRTLDLGAITPLLRQETGKETVIFLKEVIDRVIVIDLSLVPEEPGKPYWRLKDTEIRIALQTSGEREGEWLFSQDTVVRAAQFFEKVKKLPYKEGSGQGALYKAPWVERNIPAWAKGKTLGLFNWQWAGILLAIFVGLLLKLIAQQIVELFKKVAGGSKQLWDDMIVDAVERPIGLIVATLFWFVAIKTLRFEGVALNVLTIVNQAVFSFALIWLVYRLTNVATHYLQKFTTTTDFPLDDQLVPLINRALRLFVVVFGVLIAIQNMGVNVVSLLAGLGLGGLAFALAARDTAANLFGSIMILWDQPFKAGDWIKAGGAEGTVEEIGFRSTRIRTFYTSVISVPNSVLANAEIDNMGQRLARRLYTVLGVTYDTPPEKLEAFMEGIKNIIKANPWTKKDGFHVVFNNYGGSSLDVMIYCFLETADWAGELIAKNNIYLEILRLAHELEVSFAFPSQSLYLESTPDKPLAEQKFETKTLEEQAAAFGPAGRLAKPEGLGIFRPRALET